MIKLFVIRMLWLFGFDVVLSLFGFDHCLCLVVVVAGFRGVCSVLAFVVQLVLSFVVGKRNRCFPCLLPCVFFLCLWCRMVLVLVNRVRWDYYFADLSASAYVRVPVELIWAAFLCTSLVWKSGELAYTSLLHFVQWCSLLFSALTVHVLVSCFCAHRPQFSFPIVHREPLGPNFWQLKHCISLPLRLHNMNTDSLRLRYTSHYEYKHIKASYLYITDSLKLPIYTSQYDHRPIRIYTPEYENTGLDNLGRERDWWLEESYRLCDLEHLITWRPWEFSTSTIQSHSSPCYFLKVMNCKKLKFLNPTETFIFLIANNC